MSSIKSLYGLEYKFVQRDGNMLTMTKESFVNEDLSLLQLQMLEQNRIANLLPLYREEINEKITIYYEFTGFKMLTQVSKSQPLTMSGCYKLLGSIISIVLSHKQYMLDEEQYVLHSDFIFTNAQYDPVHLCYLPVRNLDKPSFRQQLLELTLKLVADAKQSNDSGLQTLLRCLNDSEITLLQLGQLLRNLAEENGRSEQEAEVHQDDWFDDVLEEEAAKDSDNKSNKATDANETKVEGVHSAKESIQNDGIRYMKWGGAVLGAVALALLALFYYHNPNEGILFVCLGLGLLVVDVVYILFVNWSEPARSTWLPATEPQLNLNTSEQIEIEGSTEDLVKQHYKQLPQATTVLRQSDATVHLNKEMREAMMNEERSMHAFLEIRNKDQVEKIQLTNEPYIIGREKEAADYVMNTLGVSRMHCEISLNGEQYELQDLNSSNGTLLNDERLVPYQTYTLKDGDQIKVVECEVVFTQTVLC